MGLASFAWPRAPDAMRLHAAALDERCAELLRVSCALRFTEICNLDQQPVQQIGDA